MTDATEHGDRSGGLWATSLDEQRRADEAAEAEARRRADEAAAERERQRAQAAQERQAAKNTAAAPVAPAVATDLPWRGFVVGTIAALAVAVLVALLAWDGPQHSRATLSSNWGTAIPMRCDTIRMRADDGRVLELFTCRGTGVTKPPDGRFGSPTRSGEKPADWSSDVDRRPAAASRIRTEDNVVRGWAFYQSGR